MSTTEYEDAVLQMRARGIPLDKAERAARALFAPIPASAVERGALEERHMVEADRIMRAFGFEVIRLSQYRRAKITEGVPDRRYYHTGRRLKVWWEAKSETGQQRKAQAWFQSLCDATDDPYVLGTVSVLEQWLIDRGVAERRADGGLEPVPYERTPSGGSLRSAEAGDGNSAS